MLKTLSTEVVMPIARRVGTATSAALIAAGVTAEVAQTAEIAVIAVCGVVFDLIVSHLSRKKR